MNEDLLSPCRACGQMISKNLTTTVRHMGSYHRATIQSGSCPHCGEVEPHVTEEELVIREEKQREKEEEQREEDKHNLVREWYPTLIFLAIAGIRLCDLRAI